MTPPPKPVAKSNAHRVATDDAPVAKAVVTGVMLAQKAVANAAHRVTTRMATAPQPTSMLK
jgi:hypothetical protein